MQPRNNPFFLIDQRILDYMEQHGFMVTETEDILDQNCPVLIFDNTVVGVNRVLVKPGLDIVCECWNDDEDAPRFSRTLHVKSANPNLQEWLLLMQAGNILEPVSTPQHAAA